MKKATAFGLLGAALGLGAPLGAFLVRGLMAPPPLLGHLAGEWGQYGFFYSYMLLGTCSVFGVFGLYLGRQTDRVLTLNRELSNEVVTDPLTGLGNHRFLHDFLKIEFRKTSVPSRPLSCLMMDLDFFKRVNDTYGHPFGDRVLVGFSKIVQQCLRQGDVATRYGGEEFLCILPNCDEKDALKAAERIRAETQKAVFRDGIHETQITVSIGAVTLPRPLGLDYQALIDAADKNLYEAKGRGRNQVVLRTLDAPVAPCQESGQQRAI